MKLVSLKDVTTKECGRNASVGLLGGFILLMFGGPSIIGDILLLAGFAYTIAWLIRKIKKQP